MPSHWYHEVFWAPQYRIDMTSGKTDDEKKNAEQDMGGKYALFRGESPRCPAYFVAIHSPDNQSPLSFEPATGFIATLSITVGWTLQWWWRHTPVPLLHLTHREQLFLQLYEK